MTTAATPRPPREDLSRELRDFLIEFSIGVHRYAMYPPDHPSLGRLAENLRAGLTLLLRSREKLTIEIGPKQLVIEGVGTDVKHPVLSDLARRLHAHQLAVVVFSKGVTILALERFLTALARDASRQGTPLGLLPPAELPTWERIVALPAGYDRMRLEAESEGEGDPDRPLHLWLDLARAALGGGEDATEAPTMGGQDVAKLIASGGAAAARDRVLVEHLMELAQELKASTGTEAADIREKVSDLVRSLDPAILRRMVAMVGSAARRKRFVLDASQALAADAVVEILQAAAAASRQTISNSLTRLLSKLAIHSRHGRPDARVLADAALRENVEALITEWELSDPNPEEYTLLLDAMANASPLFKPPAEERENVPGATRILQTALEVDAEGPTLQKAISELLDAGRIGYVLQTLDGAPEACRVAVRLRQQLTTNFQLKKLLTMGEASDESLNALVSRLGPEAVDTLLEFLTESESRANRRKVFDCLVRMGPVAGERAMEWLKDPRWFVQRNMLALMQQMDPLPNGFLPTPYLTHPDPRVRREGFPLALRVPALREKALAMALRDGDERLVRMSLLELQKGIPETVVPLVVTHVIESDALSDLRSLAIRALRGSAAPLALETLLGLCSVGRTFLGRQKLRQKSPEMLAALAVLSEVWGGDARAARVLSRAGRSRDPDLRKASAPPPAGADA